MLIRLGVDRLHLINTECSYALPSFISTISIIIRIQHFQFTEKHIIIPEFTCCSGANRGSWDQFSCWILDRRLTLYQYQHFSTWYWVKIICCNFVFCFLVKIDCMFEFIYKMRWNCFVWYFNQATFVWQTSTGCSGKTYLKGVVSRNTNKKRKQKHSSEAIWLIDCLLTNINSLKTKNILDCLNKYNSKYCTTIFFKIIFFSIYKLYYLIHSCWRRKNHIFPMSFMCKRMYWTRLGKGQLHRFFFRTDRPWLHTPNLFPRRPSRTLHTNSLSESTVPDSTFQIFFSELTVSDFTLQFSFRADRPNISNYKIRSIVKIHCIKSICSIYYFVAQVEIKINVTFGTWP